MEYGVFEQLLSIILLSVIIIAIFRRLSLPSILGYLAVGILIAIIDRYAFRDIQAYNILAKYGVVFLLFTIGLEFSMARLIALRRIVFLFGGIQVVACGCIFWLIARLLHLSPQNAFIIATTLALSSTAITSKVLSESGEVQTHTGRMTIGVLIFQDIMVVPLLIITSILANNANGHLFQHLIIELISGVMTFVIIYFVGRLLLTPFFREIARARSNELFVLAALLTALAAAYFSDIMGMSKELGAFLAGVILAGTPYHKQVASDIRPFRDVLLGLFFIGIGMSLNINTLPQTGGWILLIGTLIVLTKLIVIPFIPILLKLSDRQQAFRTGLLLSQAGEFGFVLVAVASHFKIIEDLHAQVLIGSIIFSMILSLILVQLQKPVRYFLTKRNAHLAEKYSPAEIDTDPHVIICGFGHTGQQLARVLKIAKIPYNAVDMDASCVSQAALSGEPVYYGDATNQDILLSLGLKSALAVVVCFSHEETAKELSDVVQAETQRTPLILCVKVKQGIHLTRSSSVSIIDEGIEIALLLAKQLLHVVGFNAEKITQITEQVKQSIGGEFFLGSEDVLLRAEDIKPQLYSFRISPSAAIIGSSLQTKNILIEGVSLNGLRRSNSDKKLALTCDTAIHENDVLIVSGQLDALEQFEAAVNSGENYA